jgi:low affinity Fe/Cu permease
MKKNNWIKSAFDTFSTKLTKATGSPVAFLLALTVVVIWLISGPIFNYSDTWQLVINTGTTIITFLMVFIIQQSQNKDTMALQLKLNELIAAHEGASNRLISSEDLTEEELLILKKFYIQLAELAKKEHNLGTTHSIDEANHRHSEKKNKSRRMAAGKNKIN